MASAAEAFHLSAYSGEDFRVVAGANLGDGLSTGGDTCLGDVYRLTTGATPKGLALEDAQGGRKATFALDKASRAARVARGSHTGEAGDRITATDRLILMSDRGRRSEVMLARHPGGKATLAVPLGGLQANTEYTLISREPVDAGLGTAETTRIAFARGTLITMADGTSRPIETLEAGDMVLTRDRGAQPLRWISRRKLPVRDGAEPVMIAAGTMGNSADLLLSPQHRVLLSDWRAEVMLGTHEVLIAAADLVNGSTIWARKGGMVDYVSILFDRHEVVFAEDVPCETLYINRPIFHALDAEERREVLALFPNIVEMPQNSASASRMALKSFEATALLRQVGLR